MKLEVIICGTGRDGTLSVAEMVREAFRINSINKTVCHEYEAGKFHDLFCELREKKCDNALKKIKNLISDCPYEVIVGNGYAAILEMFADQYPNVRLIHLMRRDKQEFIKSFSKMARLNPDTNVYYSCANGGARRVAAFHVGSKTRKEWEALSLSEKIGWYYDWTHAEINRRTPLFNKTMIIHTEDLHSKTAREELCAFIDLEAQNVPPAMKLNSFIFAQIDDYPEELAAFAIWLYGRHDFKRGCREIEHNADYFMNAFISYMGYQQTGLAEQICPASVLDKNQQKNKIVHFMQMTEKYNILARSLLKKLA